jgi:hypothetical protein
MILTTHILSGAALGANIQNPYLVATSAVALHFALDTLPHGDYLNKKSRLGEFWKVAVDFAVGFGLVFAIIFSGRTADADITRNVLIGIFFSLLPDLTTFLHNWMKAKFLLPVRNFHESLHWAKNGSPEREFRLKNNLWDIVISFISLFTLISLR